MSAGHTPSGTVAFIGLGQMGLPMARKLVEAGHAVRASDLAAAPRDAFSAYGGTAFATAREAAVGAGVLITMLPNGAIVRDILLGEAGAAQVLAPRALVIDMSSSAPLGTRSLGDALRAMDLRLVDAPVSGGVSRAEAGTLAIMLGGEAGDVEAARPVLAAIGDRIFPTGRLGSAHAMKALNNYVSAVGLVAACEALLVGEAFGLAPNTVVDILDASTGRNNSTDVKLKPFVISRTFASGFSMALMAKDIRTAADLAKELGRDAPFLVTTADLWDRAVRELPARADHTSIYEFLEAQGRLALLTPDGAGPPNGSQSRMVSGLWPR